MREYGKRKAWRAWFSAKFGQRAFLIFLVGFLAGLALIYIGQDGLVQNTSFLDHVSLEGISALEINRNGLLLYSLRQRLVPAGILVLAAAAGVGSAAACLFLLWSGFCAGALLSVLSLRYGIRGILLFAGGILPQAVVLVPACLLLCGWCAAFRRPPASDGRLPVFSLSADAGILFFILCLLLCGCVLEGYVNPSILSRALLLFQT